MEDENKIPNKPRHTPDTDRLQHALFESDNQTYKGDQNKNKNNEKKDKNDKWT